MVRLPPRLLGVVLLTLSGGSTLAHRVVYHTARQGPAGAIEFGLALLTFVLASTGVLLLIHGAKLFDWERLAGPTIDGVTPSDLQIRLEAPITPPGRTFDTRHGASMMQSQHAIAMSQRLPSCMIIDAVGPQRAGQDCSASRRR